MSSILALLGVVLAVHAAWVLVRNPKEWPLPRRNSYAVCVLLAAVGASIWGWGWGNGSTSVTALLGVVLTVLGCLGASFVGRRRD
jgi:multidrug transporter EmrE-like cation transporter